MTTDVCLGNVLAGVASLLSDRGFIVADPDLPYVLWEEKLPKGNAAKLIIVCPTAKIVGLVLHWNGELHSLHTAPSRERAEQKGWELHEQVLSGELAGKQL